MPVRMRCRDLCEALVGRLLAPLGWAEVEGVRLALDHPVLAPAMRYAVWRGWERQDVPLLARLLRPGEVVLECGVGIGFLALQACCRLGAGGYFGVEAHEGLLDLIRHNFALNGRTAPPLLHAAVAAQEGRMPFHRSRRLWSSSLVRRRADAETVEVPALPLPALRARARRLGLEPTLLVLDVEGAETGLPPEHLDGFERVLVELHPRITGADAAERWLAGLRARGFRAVARHRDSWALVRVQG